VCATRATLGNLLLAGPTRCAVPHEERTGLPPDAQAMTDALCELRKNGIDDHADTLSSERGGNAGNESLRACGSMRGRVHWLVHLRLDGFTEQAQALARLVHLQ
jgi:hypothetical protein